MQEFLDFARQMALASAEVIQPYYRTEIEIDTKSNDTPVTIADRKAEALMRQMIQERYPRHGILGEEYGVINPQAEYQWVLDPIDGTKNFITGTPLYGTLIGLAQGGQPLVGAVNFPAINDLLLGDGQNAWLNGHPVSVRQPVPLEEATMLYTDPWAPHEFRHGPAFDALSQRVRLSRSWGDCYGYYLLATGYADIMIDPVMHVWDLMALVPVVEGAGGTITDYYGNPPVGGEGIVATTGAIHDQVIAALNP